MKNQDSRTIRLTEEELGRVIDARAHEIAKPECIPVEMVLEFIEKARARTWRAKELADLIRKGPAKEQGELEDVMGGLVDVLITLSADFERAGRALRAKGEVIDIEVPAVEGLAIADDDLFQDFLNAREQVMEQIRTQAI